MSSEMKILLLIVGCFLILLTIRFMEFVRSFGKELKYLNSELRRSSPSERPRWKRARRRLWLSLIPFYNPKKKTHRKQ